MRLIPYARRLAIAAGASSNPIQVYGRYISILSISASTIMLRIDQDPPQEVFSGTQLDLVDHRYKDLELYNTGAVASNVILILSNIPVRDLKGDVLLAAIAASLASIDGSLDVDISDTMIPISTDGDAGQWALTASGGADPHVTGANQACREVMIQTSHATVYFRVKAGVLDAAATDFKMIADVPYTFAIENLNMVHVYNGDAAAAATVYYQWRN